MQPRLLKEPLRLAGPAVLALQTDARLVQLVRDGHQPAFAAVVQRYHCTLLRYCTRLVGEHRAEDAVQQTFVNAHRALTERETEVQLRPWLFRVAHNAALNTLRGDTPGVSLDDPEGPGWSTAGAGPADDVEGTVVRRERLQDTLSAISALPPVQRDALLLRELEGRSHVEIASALGVSAGAARQHLMRARAAVRATASALTPYPLLAKVVTWMTFTPTGERATQVAVGAGLGAGAAKVAAGVLATGALVGGVVGSGAVPGLRHDGPAAAAADAATAARSSRRPPAPSPGAVVTAPSRGTLSAAGARATVSVTGTTRRGGPRRHGALSSPGEDHGGHRGPASGSHGSQEGGTGTSSGSGSDDRRPETGSGSGPGSGEDRPSGHGTGSSSGGADTGTGEDRGSTSGPGPSGSGSDSPSPSGGSGSDDHLVTPAVSGGSGSGPGPSGSGGPGPSSGSGSGSSGSRSRGSDDGATVTVPAAPDGDR